MSEATVSLKHKNLDQLIKALKGNLPKASIGVLGDKNQRSGNGKLSNAEVGLIHEFGVFTKGKHIPQRSFLRVPLQENLSEKLEESGAFDKETLKKVVKEGTIFQWVQKVAVVAESVVAEAFATGGYGKWMPWAPGYTNNTSMILVDTTQLRESIGSVVE